MFQFWREKLIGKVKYKSVRNRGSTASSHTVSPAGKMHFETEYVLVMVDVSFQVL